MPTLTQAQRQMPGSELNMRAAFDRLLKCTGGSRRRELGDPLYAALLIIEGALALNKKDNIMAAGQFVSHDMKDELEFCFDERLGALIDIKEALELWAKEDEPAPYEPDPVNEGYEMSGRDCDRAADAAHGYRMSQTP